MKKILFTILATLWSISAFGAQPQPIRANAFSTNFPGNTITNTSPIQTTGEIDVDASGGGATTNQWGSSSTVNIVPGPFQMLQAAGAAAVAVFDADGFLIPGGSSPGTFTGYIFLNGTNVGVMNPTDGFIPYRFSTNGFRNSPWQVPNSTSVHLSGFTNGVGNYSGVTLSHTGTNGAAFIDSQASGTAGNPRPIYLTLGSSLGLGIMSTNRLALGSDSQFAYNDTSSFSTSLGHEAYVNHSVAVGLTAVGYQALNAAGGAAGDNTAVGAFALLSLINGSENTVIGRDAGLSVLSSIGNTFVGYSAGGVLTGGYNTGIGVSSGADPGVTPGITNSVFIGAFTGPQASNTAQIGTNGVSVLYLNGTVGWYRGNGSPEGVVAANVGSFYSRENGGAGTSFYVKESGAGNTGWAAK